VVVRTVAVRLLTGEEIRAQEVVLSAGTYASPALLLRSGIGPAAALRQLGIPVAVDLPGVGQNLFDHPAVSVDLRYDRPVKPVPEFQVTFRRPIRICRRSCLPSGQPRLPSRQDGLRCQAAKDLPGLRDGVLDDVAGGSDVMDEPEIQK
jgi:GMC oxidoreductase